MKFYIERFYKILSLTNFIGALMKTNTYIDG